MSANLQNLFGIEDGKIPRQKIYENLYIGNGVDFNPVFHEAYQRTLDDTTLEIYRGRGFMANHMSWNLIGMLKQKYEDRMGADKYDRPYYMLDSKTRVYFKKLNSNYAPENVATDHVRELNSMSLFYKEDQTTILYAGIKIENDNIWSELNGVYLVEMKDLKQPNWVSDLSELSYQMNRPNIIKPITTIQLPDEIVIKPKSNNAELGNTSEGG